MYLDDWLIRAKSKDQCLEDLSVTLKMTQSLGILVNLEKSQLSPQQNIVYLGIQMDSQGFLASPSIERIERCLSKVSVFPGKEHCSAREWMSLLGTISSLEQFVSLGRLHLRPLQYYLKENWDQSSQDLEESFEVTDKIKQDLRWWLDPKKLGQGVSLHIKSPLRALFADVSDSGWGATLGSEEVSGTWEGAQVSWHINQKELKAIHLALLHFQKQISGLIIQVNSDNTTALAYIRKQGGTHSFSLYETARELLLWAQEKEISLLMRFIQGERNVQADLLSRKNQVLPTEWTLNPQVFEQLWGLWGRPNIDLFATNRNKRLENYCSPIADPRAIAIDVLLMDWKG
ncbi:uncharacterized protein LOC135203010 [Macrobrachium nipponense]|uniref:uncharacterized protein LOC135203010 n=1 Tax=Macrobrachium nipponense TaxID=159736 RepID=UPI0030C7E0C3